MGVMREMDGNGRLQALPPAEELHFTCMHSGGPGGQGVNTSDSGVQLRWGARESAFLSEEARARLMRLAGRRCTQDGEIVIEATEFRSQRRNREAALERLSALLARALNPPARRRRTQVPESQKAKRREEKSRRSEVKANRKAVE